MSNTLGISTCQMLQVETSKDELSQLQSYICYAGRGGLRFSNCFRGCIILDVTSIDPLNIVQRLTADCTNHVKDAVLTASANGAEFVLFIPKFAE